MITVLTTGGTIDKIYFDKLSQFEVGEPQIGELLQDANITVDYRIQPLMRKDSLEMTDDDRVKIRSAVEDSKCSRILITHGTDTMVATAACLAGIPNKSIVLTGSMQPANLRLSDAVFNIGFAMASVQLLDPGVYIAMNGEIFFPDRAQKNRAQNRFEHIK